MQVTFDNTMRVIEDLNSIDSSVLELVLIPDDSNASDDKDAFNLGGNNKVLDPVIISLARERLLREIFPPTWVQALVVRAHSLFFLGRN